MSDNTQKLKVNLKALEDRRVELFKLQKPINDELVKNHNKIGKIKDKISKLQLVPSKKVNWELLLDNNSGTYSYNKYTKELTSRLLWYGGSLIPTNQRCIKVMLTKGDKISYNKTLKALKEILPFVKPMPDGDVAGYKFVDIFERTLSANGTYYILMNEINNVYKLMFSRYRNIEELKKFKTLEELILYVQNNHPYKTKGEE